MADTMSHKLHIPGSAAVATAIAAALCLIAPFAAAQDARSADEGASEAASAGPRYSLSAEAAAGMVLAADGLGAGPSDTAAVFSVTAKFLHRLEAPGWGAALSHDLNLSGPAALTGSAGDAPTIDIHEAYARLDLGDSAQVFLGKRRLELGIGTAFAPGDIMNPRSGFWDQLNGFRGLCATASLGSDISLRAAASLERAFSADEVDPSLVTWAAQAEAQLGSLQLCASGAYSPGSAARPSLGFSLGLGDLILQAEGAVELEGGPYWFGAGGARESWSSGDASLLVSLDYGYNGEPGLLEHRDYLLPYLKFGLAEAFDIYARALVGLEGPSALLSTGLTLYPVQGFDLELTGLFGLGPEGSEFAELPSLRSKDKGALRDAIGLATRVHF